MKELLITPLIGIILLILLPHKRYLYLVSLITSVIIFLQSIKLYIILDKATSSFQHLLVIPFSNINMLLGVDVISMVFIVLSTFLIMVCILISYDSHKIQELEYYVSLLFINLFLILVFTVLDILGFYIFYEAVLIPVFYLIGVWGVRKQKISAAMYFFFYTLLGSVLMLISIIYIFALTGTTDYLLLTTFYISDELQKILFIGFMASLAVKIPLYPFHVWLPLAHVEAPIVGSVLLAGILIKLGSYGMLRFILPLMPYATQYFSPFVFLLSILGVVYGSLITLRQTDLKRIVAYSSVAHMGVVTLGIFSGSSEGLEGAMFTQLDHGVVSSGLFIIVGIIYERFHTRIIRYYSGVATTMPVFTLCFFILTLSNMGVPGTSNFIGEILTLKGVMDTSKCTSVLACLGMILGAAYGLYMFNRVVFGSVSTYVSLAPRDATRRETYIIGILTLLSILLGCFPYSAISIMHVTISGWIV